jgi:hypothetical protein
LGQRRFEGALGDVISGALDDALAVLRDVVQLILGGVVIGEVDPYIEEVVQVGRRLGIVDLHRDLGNPQLGITEVGFERGFIERGLGRIGRFGLSQQREAQQQKC